MDNGLERSSRVAISIRYILLGGVLIITVAPFLWMFIGSMSSIGDLYRYPPSLPKVWRLENYTELFDRFPFGRFTINSVKIALLATIGTLLCSTLAAYAFARMEFRGKRLLYGLVLATMMVPFQVTMIPVFFVLKTLGMVGHHSALIVPHYLGFGMGAFGIFLLRGFFTGIPRELEEAARIDGVGTLGVLWRVVIPLSKPALSTLAVLTFMAHWNDLIGPVLYLSGTDSMTLTMGLAALQGGDLASRIDLVLAGAIVSMIPILVLFIIAQRAFVRGIAVGGIKG